MRSDTAFALLSTGAVDVVVAVDVVLLVVVAVLRGWLGFAAVCLITFFGPMRVGELIAAQRQDLVMPVDILEPEAGRMVIQVVQFNSAHFEPNATELEFWHSI